MKGLALLLGKRLPMESVTHYDLCCLQFLSVCATGLGMMMLGLLAPVSLIAASNKPEVSNETDGAPGYTNTTTYNPDEIVEASGANHTVGNDPRNYRLFGILDPNGAAGALSGGFVFFVGLGYFWARVYTRFRNELSSFRAKAQLDMEELVRQEHA